MPPYAPCSPEVRYTLDVLSAIIRSAPCPPNPPPNLDWPKLHAYARRHRVEPLLWHGLRHGDSIPAPIATAFRNAAYVAATRNEMLLHELADILRRLSDAGIPALPVKGPVMAAQLHGSPGLRSCEDLDILTPEARVADALTLLSRNGFTRTHPSPLWQEARQIRHGWGQGLLKTAPAINVEISPWIVPHYYAPTINMAPLMSRAGTIPIGSLTFPTLRPEDLLVLLALHGAKHGWSRLQWIADIAALLVRYPNLDWAEVDALARRAGARRAIRIALGICRQLIGPDIPRAGNSACADPTAEALARFFAGRLLTPAPTEITAAAELATNLRMADTWPLRLRHLALLGLTPSYGDWCWIQLPPPLRWLYWLLRPIRLATNPSKQKRPPE